MRMKKILLLLVAVLATTTIWATDFITDVMVIGGTQSEINIMKPLYEADGWTVIDQDLNAGCGSSSDYIYLLYKTASDTITSPDFITEFLLLKTGADAPDSVVNTSNNRTYYLVDYDGGSNFRNLKGDLNSNAHGDYIHLYYSKYTGSYDINYRVIKSIYFDNVSDGAVTSGDGMPACDLNSGCGSGSDYIYMHLEKSQGFTVTYNYVGDQCYINGFEGPRAMISSITVPARMNNVLIIGMSNETFSGFRNLESLFFSRGSEIENMPSLQGIKKFMHVNCLTQSGSVSDILPTGMTTIYARAFAGTSIKTLVMTDIESIPDDAVGAFAGCESLESVAFNKPAYIGESAFANVTSDSCVVSYNGSVEDWSYRSFYDSPNLVIKAKDSGYSTWRGWCGDTKTNNYLYWTVKDHLLTVTCDEMYYNEFPEAQIITSRRWEKSTTSWDMVKVNRVYCLRENEFSRTGIREIYLDSTLDSIAPRAIHAPVELGSIWFDGTQQQWESVRKDPQWIVGYHNYKIHWHCTVTFDANGHGTAPNPQYIEWSNWYKATEPTAPTAEGYEFTGWYTDAACTNQWDFNNVIPGDMTLYAGWQEIVVNVPGDVDGDGVVTSSDVTALYNFILNNDASSIVNGDQDGDGVITASDITTVYSILLDN